MESENPSKFPIFWIVFFSILAFVFIIMWWFLRKKNSFGRIFLYFIIVAVVIGIVFALIFLALWLLRKQRVDMIHVMKQRIVKACLLCPPKKKQTLYFRGGTDLEYRYIGDVEGVAKAKSEGVYEKIIDKETGEESSKMIKDPMDLTFIAFKQPLPFPLSLFNTAKIFVGLTYKDKDGKEHKDYSHLSGDVVYLNGMTFAPEIYGMHILSHHFKETYMYDEPVKELIYRYLIQDNLSEIKNIVDEALGISPQHRKIIERSKVHEITGGYQQNQGQQPPAQ